MTRRAGSAKPPPPAQEGIALRCEDQREALATALTLRARGALFAVNHSGGKDSQVMTLRLSRLIPPEQLLFVHAPLTDAEWPDTIEHLRATLPPGARLIFAPTASGKTLLERVRERGQFPDPKRRWCTSDFKTGPINRELRRWLKEHPEHAGQVVSCLGFRADESSERARKIAWSRLDRESIAGRHWYLWYPILDMSERDVYAEIAAAGQRPHWAYAKGASRLSCILCIYGSPEDWRIGARYNPRIYRDYCEAEDTLGHTLSPTRRTLPEITGIHPGGSQTAVLPGTRPSARKCPP